MIGAAHKTILYDYVSAAKPPTYFFRSLLNENRVRAEQVTTNAKGHGLYDIIRLDVETYYTEAGMDYRAFYFWHRVYLYVTTAQWMAALAYVVLMLRAWRATPQAA